LSIDAAMTTLDPLVHHDLECGIEFGAEVLPSRRTVALCVRLLTGLVDEPHDLTGINALVARTLSKGTETYTGQQLADAFDQRGIQWGIASGRQTTLARCLCLPEFLDDAIELLGEVLCRPTFPTESCEVALDLAKQDLQQLDDEPQDLVRVRLQRLTLGETLGRNPGGDAASLAKIQPTDFNAFWQENYHAGRMQVAVAGPVDPQRVGDRIRAAFGGLGQAQRSGRDITPRGAGAGRDHLAKDCKQQYIGMTVPGTPKSNRQKYAIEQVMLGVLSGGMSARLFTEVREKQGLVYWVSAWGEQPRGLGVIHLGASTTPERCQKTYDTLRRELTRLGEDLTEEEVRRACDQLCAHYQTEDDLTRARALSLSDDLFHHGEPEGLAPKLERLRKVTHADVLGRARSLDLEQMCVATVGPADLA
jgi:predicted Zn-dependent peptidase